MLWETICQASLKLTVMSHTNVWFSSCGKRTKDLRVRCFLECSQNQKHVSPLMLETEHLTWKKTWDMLQGQTPGESQLGFKGGTPWRAQRTSHALLPVLVSHFLESEHGNPGHRIYCARWFCKKWLGLIANVHSQHSFSKIVQSLLEMLDLKHKPVIRSFSTPKFFPQPVLSPQNVVPLHSSINLLFS